MGPRSVRFGSLSGKPDVWLTWRGLGSLDNVIRKLTHISRESRTDYGFLRRHKN